MKDARGKITYKGVEYDLVFNINTMEEIQEEYGTVDKWGALTDGSTGEPNAKAIKFGFAAMLNEGIDIKNEDTGSNTPHFTKQQVGRMLTEIGLTDVTQAMNNTVIDSTKTDDGKNV